MDGMVVDTPHNDRLSKRDTSFPQASAGGSRSAPARAGLRPGRWTLRQGIDTDMQGPSHLVPLESSGG